MIADTDPNVLLEAQIDAAYLACATARDPEARREAFHRMRALIAQRSPERVAEMELERLRIGLSKALPWRCLPQRAA